MQFPHLPEQELIRREKLADQEKLGINPYSAALCPVNIMFADVERDNKGVKTGETIIKRRRGKPSICHTPPHTGHPHVHAYRQKILPEAAHLRRVPMPGHI